ncbi:M16 family metallopeptidase [Pseudooceanicola spongiae]|uniref:Insulinase family protein n=1 Tax=Pseudooceanicola spongiae TaxID=2613965 RepID=A0A7L9WQT1_9RHOB|nr:pitrilysin family protein [Pseudooceanicola spongiae]QOL82252.1 insulinase family protein [Pseudooceanicola spongiae]
MLRRFAVGALTLTALTTPAIAQQTVSDLVTDFTLDNGMQVVVIEDHRAPVVVQMVWYRAGSADEKPGVSGIAHFLEHLMFKGTDSFGPGKFSATVAANGGTDNAFTNYDFTAYHQRVAADRLPLMMEMEADRMTHLNLDEDAIKTERQVILEERSMRTDSNPQALFGEQTRAAQYLNHHYGIPVIGWRHEMEQLNLQEAEDFYKMYYAPNNATLVVAGDVTPDEVHKLADQYYGVIPANPDLPDRVRPQEPEQRAERRVIFKDARVAQPYVSRTYLAPERDHDDQKPAAALVMLAQLLGGGQSGYLTDKLVFEKKIATYTSAFYNDTSLDDTNFGVYAVPAPGVSLEDAEAALDDALASFIKDGVDPAALERIKMQVRASQVYDRDDVAGLAQMYGAALSQGLTVSDIQAWPEILQEVQPDDIIAAAKQVLNKDHAVTGYLMSDKEVTQ